MTETLSNFTLERREKRNLHHSKGACVLLFERIEKVFLCKRMERERVSLDGVYTSSVMKEEKHRRRFYSRVLIDCQPKEC